MAETVVLWFGNRKFFVSPSEIKGFKGLKIKIALETEEKEVNGEKIVSRKNYGITTVELTAILSAYAGSDVQADAMGIITDCQYAKEDFIYDAAGAKLWPFKLLLTEAEIATCEIGPRGVWTYAEVRMTFKQSTTWSGTSAGDGNGSSGGGGGGKTKSYVVKIPGRSFTVKASSIQGAITAALSEAGQPEYSGVVTVDGYGKAVKKGKLITMADKARDAAQKAIQQGKKAADVEIGGGKETITPKLTV